MKAITPSVRVASVSQPKSFEPKLSPYLDALLSSQVKRSISFKEEEINPYQAQYFTKQTQEPQEKEKGWFGNYE